jgi:sucrose phosphorylase
MAMTKIVSDRIRAHLSFVYGESSADEIASRIETRMEAFRSQHPALQDSTRSFSERDAILITYGDQIREPGKPPLRTLDETLYELAGEVLNGVHILPFFPYSSDDGFSVIDYKEVDPALGDWSDVKRMGDHFQLMFDAVINHISRESAWFQGFLRGEEPYKDYFIVVDPDTDLSQVVRPRALPLLTPVETNEGVKYVWTTFSEDQIDLNYANPAVLLEVLDVLLFYVAHGARLIRLDAIGFMWKEIGASCLHLPQTHQLIQLMRAVLDGVAPGVLLITETNVPHQDNISYFGDGYNEAQMVYNFTLPPLTMHAFMTGDATHLTEWASTLAAPSDQTTFFNFMASHDGVGLRPLEGVLPPAEMEKMAERVLAHGGLVSYKTNTDGSQSPYELNVVYFDALNDPEADEPASLQVDRFMASQAILLSLMGTPGIYVHSFFGSRNWNEGVAETGRNRTINRRKFQRAELEAELADPDSIPHQVFVRYRELLRVRTAEPAFHPNGGQRVIDLHPALFAFVRRAPDHSSQVICIHNVSEDEVPVEVDLAELGVTPGQALVDLVSGERYQVDDKGRFRRVIRGCGVWWLRIK